MKSKFLWKFSLVTNPEAEDAVGELCRKIFGCPPVSYTDVKTGKVTVTVYLPERWRGGEWREKLREGVRAIKSAGLDPGSGRMALQRLAQEDWSESWKRHFYPLEIGRSLLVKPSWSRRRPGKHQAVVVIDPGLSFGTGQHPTTGFCLRKLVRLRRPFGAQAVLDMGTGSGILAIAAAKLGYQPVDAFDLDATAVQVARSNAERNGVGAQVRFWRCDVTRLPVRASRQYEVICANLIAPLLVSQRERLAARLKAGGVLLLAGILDTEFDGVRRAFEQMGMELMTSRREKEWRSGAFRLRY